MGQQVMESRGADRGRRAGEQVVKGGLQLTTLASVITTLGFVIVLFSQAAGFFGQVSLGEFLSGTIWSPVMQPRQYGVLPLVGGSLLVTVVALLFAGPLGLGTACYLSEYATGRARRMIRPALNLLAGVPTVVYGYVAVVFVTPHLLRPWVPGTEVYSAASAGLVVGIMVLPMIAGLCDASFRAVPAAMRHGAYAVGATQQEVCLQVVLPAARRGVWASFALAISRAIGETMAVTMAAGALPQLTADPRQPVQTMTACIVQIAQGDAPAGSINYQSVFAVGALLFLITCVLNIGAHRVLARYGEEFA